jgi:hypothetical protein
MTFNISPRGRWKCIMVIIFNSDAEFELREDIRK